MKKKKKTKPGSTRKKIANLLTASLALGPALYMTANPAAYALLPVTLSAPYVKSPLPDLLSAAGQPVTLDLRQYFENVESFTTTVNNLEDFTASVNGNMLTLTGNRTGTATLTVTGINESSRFVTDTFHVTVVPAALDRDNNNKIDLGEVAAYLGANRTDRQGASQLLNTVSTQSVAPMLNNPPRANNTTFSTAKNSTSVLDPDTLFFDPDNDSLTFETFSLNTNGIVSAHLSGNQLIVTGTQPGTVKLDVTARDGRGGKANGRYNFSVTDSTYNNFPYWTGGLTNITVTKNTYFSPAIDLKNGFVDPDGDVLQFNPVQISGESIQALQSGSILNIFGKNSGTSTVTASVYDGKGGTAMGSFNVRVNQNPVLIGSPISSMSIFHNEYAHFPVSTRFSDPDNDTLSYSATIDSGNTLTVTMEIVSGTTYANISGMPVGTNTVTLKAQDSYGGSVTETFIVHSTNRAPVPPGEPTNLNTTLGNSISTNLSSYFYDPDMDTLAYSVTSSDPAAVSAVISSGQLNLIPISRGSSNITLSATDSYATVPTTFNVTIDNSVPLIKSSLPVPAKTILISGSVVVLANDIFSDADGDSLQFSTFGLSTLGIATGSLASGVLTLNGLGVGTVTVSVNVYDGYGGTKSGSFDVSVNPLP